MGLKVSEITYEATHVILINSYHIFRFVKGDDNMKENITKAIEDMNYEYIDKLIDVTTYGDGRELHTYISYLKPKQ